MPENVNGALRKISRIEKLINIATVIKLMKYLINIAIVIKLMKYFI